MACRLDQAPDRGQADQRRAVAGYLMPGVCVDGNDFSAVAEAMHAAIARARAGDGKPRGEPDLSLARPFKSDRNRYRTGTRSTAGSRATRSSGSAPELIAHGVVTRRAPTCC